MHPFSKTYAGKSVTTARIDNYILDEIKKCIQSNNGESIKIYISLINRIIIYSVNNLSLATFSKYIEYPAKYYVMGLIEKEHNFNLGVTATMQLIDNVIHTIHSKANSSKNEDERKEIIKFLYRAFYSFSKLFKSMIDVADINSFKSSLKSYRQLQLYTRSFFSYIKNSNADEKSLLNEEYLNYYSDVKYGLKAWLWYLYALDKIGLEHMNIYSNNIDLLKYTPTEFVNKLVFLATDESRNYMDWDKWDHTNRSMVDSYTLPSPIDWMSQSFLLLSLKNENFQIDKNKIVVNRHSELSYIRESINNYEKEITNSFSKWVDVLGFKDVNILNRRIENINKEINKIL